MTKSPVQPQRSLFRKYFTVLFFAVVVPLLVNGGVQTWFGYRDQRAFLDSFLRREAGSASTKIQGFLDGIEDQLGWAVQIPWPDKRDGSDEQHQVDAKRIMRLAPAIFNLTLVDGTGRERLSISRLELDRIGSGFDLSEDPAVLGARSARVWYGPVVYRAGSEPFMSLAVSGNRPSVGVAIAQINLKLIRDVISAIKIGDTGQAFVVDKPGRLIAHPDINLVLRGTDETTLRSLQELRAAVAAGASDVTIGSGAERQRVVAAMTSIAGVDWSVFVIQPAPEAFASIYALMWRTGGVLLLSIIAATLLAYWLALRTAVPIHLLEEGASRIGAGQFDHRIEIETGDEFQSLAQRLNEMASGLAVSQERSERIARLRRFLAPQVAELVDSAGHESLLEGQRTQVVVAFCDLRGFTTFSSRVEPDEVMIVLNQYHEVLGAIITRYGATLTSFSGDGLMVLVNAPVPCPDPAYHAIRMVIDMQNSVQDLILEWTGRGHRIGFGIGLAMGPATVGRIGYEGRYDYTAIGTVVNLASRLCSLAANGQILIDEAAAASVGEHAALVDIGPRLLRGYDQEVPIFAIKTSLNPGDGSTELGDVTGGPNSNL